MPCRAVDQGSQFTGSAWITTLGEAGVRISHLAFASKRPPAMDGWSRPLHGHIFIERLWRSLTQEAIYLEEINDGFQALRDIRNWVAFYITERPHSA